MSKKPMKAFTDTDFVMTARKEGIEDANKAIEADKANQRFVFANVPIPARTGRKAELSYPIGTLAAGTEQSFFVETKDHKKTTASIRTFAYRNDFKVIIRSEAEGVRVWRKQ